MSDFNNDFNNGGKRCENVMNSPNRTRAPALCRRRLAALILSAALSAGSLAWADPAVPRVFSSPEQAAEALAAAWRSGATDQLLALFGPEGARLVRSGDPAGEQFARKRLAAAYGEAHRIESEGEGKAVIVLGKDAWPYPIPLVRQEAGWRFDAKAGAEQIVDRRIGRNESNAINVCRAYVEAQQGYARMHRLAGGRHEYARRVASTPGKHDGLYWPTSGREDESPLGPLVAAADAQGYGAANAEGLAPFHGYLYRILTRQGKSASGGARDYVADGKMTGGFAMVAFPAKYGDSGVMTFVVNQHGIVFEKNLGPDTSAIARHMSEYNPDASWKVAQPLVR